MHQTEKLYRVIKPENTYLASSKDTPGAVRGTLLSNDNSQLVGQAEFEEVENSSNPNTTNQEQDAANALVELLTALALIGVGVVATKATPHIKNFATKKALPQIKKAWSWVTGKKNSPKNLKNDDFVNIDAVDEQNTMPSQLTIQLNIAHKQYENTPNNEDAKKALLDIAIESAMLLNKIKNYLDQYAGVASVNSDSFSEWHSVLETVTSLNIVDSLNRIIESNSSLLNTKQSTFLTDVLGYDVVSDKNIIPIQSHRLADALSFPDAA